MLGDNDGLSCSPSLIDVARRSLGESSYTLSYNIPFKGGYITRSFGKPESNQHALQLEMSQDIYMDEMTLGFDNAKAARLWQCLEQMILALGEHLLIGR